RRLSSCLRPRCRATPTMNGTKSIMSGDSLFRRKTPPPIAPPGAPVALKLQRVTGRVRERGLREDVARIIILSISLLWLLPVWAQQHGQGHSERRGPSDITQYIEALERPERDKDQRPDEVIKALNLDEYMTIADIGAGSGYFTRKFVWAVQDKGMVYAIDI